MALQHEPGAAFDALVWLGSDGIVRNSHQNVLPSAHLQVGSIGGVFGRVLGDVVYRDERGGVWGFFFEGWDEGTGAAMPLATEPVRTLQVTSPGTSRHDLAIGFLPVGGRDPELTTRPGVEWTSGELGESGRVAFLAVGVAAGATPLVTSVTYTDQTGKRLTYHP